MQAPPFWMWMFRIAGIACLVTLLTPTFYLIKYAAFDYPKEAEIADTKRSTLQTLSAPTFPRGTSWYIKSAEGKENANVRQLAVERLGNLAASTKYQITYPVECLHAKLALEQVAASDPDPAVRKIARSTLIAVAEHGAVVSR
jgi:hypothetical protein